MMGHWFVNGRKIMNAGAADAFTWNGNTTNYALYAVLVDSGIYTPDTYTDVDLSTAIASDAEPAEATGYLRQPVRMDAITTAQKTNPDANYVIYPANASYGLSFTVNAPSQTLTAGLIIFYWDLNVKNSLVTPLTAYYPSGSNNTYDSASQMLGYASFVDADTGDNYWTTTTTPAIIAYEYDTTFTGSSTILSAQI